MAANSQIILNCSLNFRSLRIEDPKKTSPNNCHNSAVSPNYPHHIIRAIPELDKHFLIKEMIGKGTFSRVYRAKLAKNSSNECALKCIVPTIKWDKIADELRFLRDLGGDSNIIGVKTCFFGGGYTVIVMPYFRHDEFVEVIKDITGPEVKEYMRNLFIALAKIHKAGVIHRDVKPNNFLYNRKLKLYGLVDFGLAQETRTLLREARLKQAQIEISSQRKKRVVLKDLTKSNTNHAIIAKDTTNPVIIKKRSFESMAGVTQDSANKKLKTDIHSDRRTIPDTPPKNLCKKFDAKLHRLPMKSLSRPTPCDCLDKPQICSNCSARQELFAPRGGTPGFRAPEVLMKYLKQTTAIDIWSAGVIMASLLSRRYPFFRNTDDLTSLAEIITLLGSERVCAASRKLKRSLIFSPKYKPPLNLKMLCEKLRGSNQMEVDDSAYDLLNCLLEPNPYERITAMKALDHAYFQS